MKQFLAIFVFCFLFEAVVPQVAQARFGGGRSSGRSFGGGSSGGSLFRSRQAPQQPRYNQPNYNQRQPPQAPARSGFWRGLAGGLAGGFLGSMLFNSLGLGRGFGGFGGTGGFGIFEILLIGGALFLLYKLLKPKHEPTRQFGEYAQPLSRKSEPYVERSENFYGQTSEAKREAQGIDEDMATDLFYKMQAAWTRKNLDSVKDLIGDELKRVLNADMADLVRAHRTNRLENISLRSVEVGEPLWEEGHYVSPVRFVANMLDYTVDDRSSQVVEGSDTQPVKFEEIWTFRKSEMMGRWQLVAIDQN